MYMLAKIFHNKPNREEKTTLVKLGSETEELQNFFEPNHNVHDYIKRMVSSSRMLYDSYAYKGDHRSRKKRLSMKPRLHLNGPSSRKVEAGLIYRKG